ncbi:Inner membrane protein YohC [compost metagenome]
MTPFFIAGLAGLYPSRWLTIAVLAAASAYSTFLLFIGLPTFMHERKEQGLLNAACVWGVGLLVLVTILVTMILVWFNVLTPEYLRAPVG